MNKDVENKMISNCTNVQLYEKCAVIRKETGWQICDAKGKSMCDKIWRKVEVVGNYIITTDTYYKEYMYCIEDEKLSLVIGEVELIKWVNEDFFIINKDGQKALYKGKQVIIKFGVYTEIKINFEFKLIFTRNALGLYGVVAFSGYWYLDNCEDIQPWRNEKVQVLKFLKKGGWGVYRIGVGCIVPNKMSMVKLCPNYIECYIGKKKGIYDLNGNEIIPVSYISIKEYGGKVFKVARKVDDKYLYGAFDINGRKLLSTRFYRVKIDLEKGEVKGVNFLIKITKKIIEI